MLVVKRGVGQRLVFSGGIELTIVSIGRGVVKMAVSAPSDVWIARGEVHDATVEANAAAAATLTSVFPSTPQTEAALPAEGST